MIARKIIYEGRVQGVGFRYTCCKIARGYSVVGWVCNLTDGSVELQVKGERQQVVDFLAAIREHDLGSCIRNESSQQLDESELEGQNGFTVKRESNT